MWQTYPFSVFANFEGRLLARVGGFFVDSMEHGACTLVAIYLKKYHLKNNAIHKRGVLGFGETSTLLHILGNPKVSYIFVHPSRFLQHGTHLRIPVHLFLWGDEVMVKCVPLSYDISRGG